MTGDAIGRLIGLMVTNAIKLGGLYIAIRTVTSAVPNAVIVGLAAFMMAGAQISEETILNLFGKMFGAHQAPKDEEHRS